MKRRIFNYLFKSQIREFENKVDTIMRVESKLIALFESIDVSVDLSDPHNYHHRSWAVISIQGHKSDFIRFMDLSDRDIHEVARFMRRFERSKIDAWPGVTAFMRMDRNW